MKKLFYLLFVLSALSFSACKSNKKSNPTPTGPSKTGSTLDLIRDSVFLYAQEDYLWNTALPSYATFNPRSFTAGDDLTALTNEVNALSQYAINPATGKPYEYYLPDPGQAKYSFIDAGAVSAELNGTKGDFGLGVQYNDVNDLRITYVYPGSPADVAHIKRGYQVTSVNGRTSLAYDGNGTSANVNFLNDAFFNSNTISLVLQKPDGTSLTVNNMSVANYTVNPVLKDTVYTVATGKKVGYIVFNSFTSDANADPQLNAAFNYFTAQGITDLVVDLRYNGGGYVSTAEYIDNLIVPAAKTGSLMYNTYYNSILTSGKEVLLKNQWRRDPNTGQDYNYGQFSYAVADNAVNFAKIGTLNVSRVFFIMTSATASASELTINNLRPVMDVQFVGSTSYGKPVGFFDIDINKYQLYIPEFYTQNSAGQGGYYNGFTPGNTAAGYPGVAADDDMTKNFGDPTEGLLARILNYVKTGSYVLPVTTSSIQSVSTLSLNQKNAMVMTMNKNKFTGMIGNKKMKLKK